MVEQRDRTVADQPIAALDAVTHQGALASVHTRASIPLGARVLSQARDVDNVAFECFECFGVFRHAVSRAIEAPGWDLLRKACNGA